MLAFSRKHNAVAGDLTHLSQKDVLPSFTRVLDLPDFKCPFFFAWISDLGLDMCPWAPHDDRRHLALIGFELMM